MDGAVVAEEATVDGAVVAEGASGVAASNCGEESSSTTSGMGTTTPSGLSNAFFQHSSFLHTM